MALNSNNKLKDQDSNIGPDLMSIVEQPGKETKVKRRGTLKKNASISNPSEINIDTLDSQKMRP